MADEANQHQYPAAREGHHEPTPHVDSVPSATNGENTEPRPSATVDTNTETTPLRQVLAGIQQQLDANDATIRTISRLQAQNQAALDALKRRGARRRRPRHIGARGGPCPG